MWRVWSKMAKFTSRFSSNKINPQILPDDKKEQVNEDQHQSPKLQQQHLENQRNKHSTTDDVKEDNKKSLYKKIFPNVNSFKNKAYPSNLFSADHVKVNENGPIIGNLDKYHTVNIYSNTYKETAKG